MLRNVEDPGVAARAFFCAWLTFMLNGLTQENFWDAKVTHQMSFVIAWMLFWLGSSKLKSSTHVGKRVRV